MYPAGLRAKRYLLFGLHYNKAMRKANSLSFILSLKLNTADNDERILNKRFYVAFLIKNRLIRHARKVLSSMRQDKEYRTLMAEYLSLKGKDDAASKHRRNELGKELSRIRMAYGLSEYRFHSWVVLQQHRYRKYIDSNTAQKIATAVWSSVEAVLYRKGKTVHFQRLDSLMSLEGKNNASGIRYKDGRLYWLGLCIQPQLRKDDVYAREALKHRVKYCRIVRKAMGTTYHWYLQLVLEGVPPQKHETIDGRVGLDQGTSSEAVFSEHGCILTELAPDNNDISRKVRKLSRKLDRSRRAMNPDNYNVDGTIKPKQSRKPWVHSKTYKADRMRLKTLRRRNVDTVHQSGEVLANEILEHHGSDIITEKMDYKALQLKAKEDIISIKTGKHRSRKRFGKSLAKHAPARFLSVLERKLSYINKTVNYVDTWKFKTSQYDHVLGDYVKSGLSSRSRTVGGLLVQRDLYSAFLLWAALDDTTVDRNLCFDKFPLFLSYQGACISKLLKDNKHYPLSFGLKDFAA